MPPVTDVEELAAKLVIDDLGNADLEAGILEKPVDGRGDRLVLLYRRTHDLAKNAAVEEEGKGHSQRNDRRSLSNSASNSRQNSFSASVMGRSMRDWSRKATCFRLTISSGEAGSLIFSSVSSVWGSRRFRH